MKKTPLLLAATCIVLASCSTQILSSLASTTTSSVVTTTTIPTGDVQSLLNDMLTNATGMGDLIVSGDKSGYRQRLQNMEAAFVALKPQLEALDAKTAATRTPEQTTLVEDVERILLLARNAVNKKRPADADKAARFIPLVIDGLK